MYTAETLKAHLDKLLSDESYINIDLGYIPPSNIEALLNEINETDLTDWQDYDANGWDLDFWFYFKYKDVSLLFSGSWYYGKYVIRKGER